MGAQNASKNRNRPNSPEQNKPQREEHMSSAGTFAYGTKKADSVHTQHTKRESFRDETTKPTAAVFEETFQKQSDVNTLRQRESQRQQQVSRIEDSKPNYRRTPESNQTKQPRNNTKPTNRQHIPAMRNVSEVNNAATHKDGASSDFSPIR